MANQKEGAEWVARSEVFLDWLRDHGIDPKRVYHVDISIDAVDSPTITVYRYAVNPDGMMYADPETGDAATEAPRIYPVVSMPDMLYARTEAAG
jgi:hypothetical protein